jgi:hypothetical protein
VALAAAGCADSKQTVPVIPETTTSAPATAPTQSDPVTIEIPAIKVAALLVPLGLDKNKTVQVPDLNHVDQASWYCADHEKIQGTLLCPGGGVIPGNTGPAAIYGHIDGHQRDGVFKHLPELNTDDLINIKRADGTTLTFKVYRVQQVHKANFSSAQVYGDVTRPELRLITCTGKFVGGQLGYQDQGIVYAALT